MKKSNDRRIRYTRYALQNALIACMQQNGFCCMQAIKAFCRA